MAAVLALIGHHAFHAEEEPSEGFVHDRDESVLFVNLSGPEGAVLPAPAATLPVDVIVERHEWEIWRRPSDGFEEARSLRIEGAAGVEVRLSGSLGAPASESVLTDASGTASTSFTASGERGSPALSAAAESSSSTLDFSQPGEEWAYQRSEGTITASLASPGGAAGIPAGESRALVLSVAYETWDVEASNYGETRAVNRASSPAAGANVEWSVAGGDAHASGSGVTDWQGFCETGVVMGSVDSVVRADVGYATGEATYATLHLSAPPPDPPAAGSPAVYLRSETRPALVAFSADGPAETAPGEVRNLTGTVRWDVWDVWGDGAGSEEERYNHSYDAPGVVVNLVAEQGDGLLWPATATTDGGGAFAASYQMGGGPARIVASIDGGAAAIGLDLAPAGDPGAAPDPDPADGATEPDWQFLETRGAYTLEGPTLDGPSYDLDPGGVRTVSVAVSWDSWEVWFDPASGETREENRQRWPASSTPVEFAVAQGDGAVSGQASTSVATGSDGVASVDFTMGVETTRVAVGIPGTDQSVSVDFTPPASAGTTDSFQHVRDEGLISLSLSTDPEGAEVVPGASLPVRAFAHAQTWEVWEDAAGQTELRNHYEGPAISAEVAFSILGVGVASATTDSGGLAYASVTPSSDPVTVGASVSFRGVSANAELVLTPTGGDSGAGDPGDAGGGTDPGGTGGAGDTTGGTGDTTGDTGDTTGGTGPGGTDDTTVDWAYQSTHDELLVTLEPGAAGFLDVLVQLRTYELWTHPNETNPEIRSVSVGPAQNAEVVVSTPDGAAFATGPHLTGVDGRVQIAYSAGSNVTFEAQATFAGMTASDEETAQAADGLGEGTGTGGGTGGTGGGDGTTDGSGGDGRDGRIGRS